MNSYFKKHQHNLAAVLHDYWAKWLTCMSPESGGDLFNRSVKEIMAPFINRGRNKEECRVLTSAWAMLLKQSLKTGLGTDRLRFTMSRNKVTQTLRKAKANFFLEIIANAQANGKTIWQNVNKLVGHKCKQDKELELSINDSSVRDPIALATSLNHFCWESVDEMAKFFSSPECNKESGQLYPICPLDHWNNWLRGSQAH